LSKWFSNVTILPAIKIAFPLYKLPSTASNIQTKKPYFPRLATEATAGLFIIDLELAHSKG
jgi:hypothetical protein